ncbi:MAG: SPFH domain-containing protein [Alphaproteobacteria bacterium]|nr:MAG: SPFH domain-containing protein [Alphaproteobacteria bacterium]
MIDQVQTASDHRALRLSEERPAATMNGYAMLLVLLAAAATTLGGFGLVTQQQIVIGVGLFLLGAVVTIFVTIGFYLLQPNQAAALLLFGAYRGTDRSTGLRGRMPWLTRHKISTRVHNVTSNRFLFVQIESAVRAIGARYPYDDIEHQETTLRGHADVVSHELATELQERVAVAGITIDECRLTHLAYAAEIAQSMLRRQQAEAVIAARQKIVIGAVSMVENALQLLSEKNVVELDDERRAAMVSNLMVVLCSERDTQPVVNTGTLYQ